MEAALRLINALDPTPANERHLRPAFIAENVALLRRFVPRMSLFCMLALLLTIPLDLTYFAADSQQMIPLRLLQIAGVGLLWITHCQRQIRHLHAISSGTCMAIWITTIIIAAVLNDPSTIVTFAIMTAATCLLLFPPTWLIGLFASYNLAYVALLPLIIPRADSLLIRTINGTVILSTLFFGVVYRLIYRSLWENFTARKQVELLNQRLQDELALARNIQRGLLPAPQPGWAGLDLIAFNLPALEVGGDFYAYHAFEPGHVSAAIGDISGKGLPAALLMATTYATLQSTLAAHRRPAQILQALDEGIAVYTRSSGQNCGLCYLELEGQILRVANAGGMMPILRRAAGAAEWLEVSGLPLGRASALTGCYPEISRSLEPGDLVIMTSDGVVEATNDQREMFGFDRLLAIVQAGAGAAPAMLEQIRSALGQFTGASQQHDDITIVVLGIQ